jgi:hypothetical protein
MTALKMDRKIYHFKSCIGINHIQVLTLASKTSSTKRYATPLQEPIFICLSCCAILACTEVGT